MNNKGIAFCLLGFILLIGFVTTQFSYDIYASVDNNVIDSSDSILHEDAFIEEAAPSIAESDNSLAMDKNDVTYDEQSYTNDEESTGATGVDQALLPITKHSGYSYGPVSFVYSGQPCKPTFKYINYGKNTILLEGTDYKLSYKDNINVGTATMTVTGIGKYSGFFKVSYKITPYILMENEVPMINKQLYSGSQIKPVFQVITDNGILTENKEYTIQYGENLEPEKNVGSIVVTGVGNYAGTIRRTFLIEKVPINNTTIKGVNLSYVYNGNVIKPEPRVLYNGIELHKGVDYTVSYGKNTSVGRGSLTVTGIGNHFKDSKIINFEIKKRVLFNDVKDESHPYYKAIYWALDNGIAKGYVATNTFGINDACTRGQAVMFLWRIAGKPEPPKGTIMPFSDVPKNHAYRKAILWAAGLKIAKGFSNGEFGINKKCTRGQIATFIWRYKGCEKPKSLKNPFKDTITTAYYKAVLWVAEHGIANGYKDMTFRDTQYCSRGQIITFLYRMETK